MTWKSTGNLFRQVVFNRGSFAPPFELHHHLQSGIVVRPPLPFSSLSTGFALQRERATLKDLISRRRS